MANKCFNKDVFDKFSFIKLYEFSWNVYIYVLIPYKKFIQYVYINYLNHIYTYFYASISSLIYTSYISWTAHYICIKILWRSKWKIWSNRNKKIWLIYDPFIIRSLYACWKSHDEISLKQNKVLKNKILKEKEL